MFKLILFIFYVWQSGVDKLEEGEKLQFDPSAYNYMLALSIGWPCLRYKFLVYSVYILYLLILCRI